MGESVIEFGETIPECNHVIFFFPVIQLFISISLSTITYQILPWLKVSAKITPATFGFVFNRRCLEWSYKRNWKAAVLKGNEQVLHWILNLRLGNDLTREKSSFTANALNQATSTMGTTRDVREKFMSSDQEANQSTLPTYFFIDINA